MGGFEAGRMAPTRGCRRGQGRRRRPPRWRTRTRTRHPEHKFKKLFKRVLYGLRDVFDCLNCRRGSKDEDGGSSMDKENSSNADSGCFVTSDSNSNGSEEIKLASGYEENYFAPPAEKLRRGDIEGVLLVEPGGFESERKDLEKVPKRLPSSVIVYPAINQEKEKEENQQGHVSKVSVYKDFIEEDEDGDLPRRQRDSRIRFKELRSITFGEEDALEKLGGEKLLAPTDDGVSLGNGDISDFFLQDVPEEEDRDGDVLDKVGEFVPDDKILKVPEENEEDISIDVEKLELNNDPALVVGEIFLTEDGWIFAEMVDWNGEVRHLKAFDEGGKCVGRLDLREQSSQTVYKGFSSLRKRGSMATAAFQGCSDDSWVVLTMRLQAGRMDLLHRWHLQDVVDCQVFSSEAAGGILVVTVGANRKFRKVEVREVEQEKGFVKRHKSLHLQQGSYECVEVMGVFGRHLVLGGDHWHLSVDLLNDSCFDLLEHRVLCGIPALPINTVVFTECSGRAHGAFLQPGSFNREVIMRCFALDDQQDLIHKMGGISCAQRVGKDDNFFPPCSSGATVAFAFSLFESRHCAVAVGDVQNKTVLASFSLEEPSLSFPELRPHIVLSGSALVLERHPATGHPRAAVLRIPQEEEEGQRHHILGKDFKGDLSRGIEEVSQCAEIYVGSKTTSVVPGGGKMMEPFLVARTGRWNSEEEYEKEEEWEEERFLRVNINTSTSKPEQEEQEVVDKDLAADAKTEVGCSRAKKKLAAIDKRARKSKPAGLSFNALLLPCKDSYRLGRLFHTEDGWTFVERFRSTNSQLVMYDTTGRKFDTLRLGGSSFGDDAETKLVKEESIVVAASRVASNTWSVQVTRCAKKSKSAVLLSDLRLFAEECHLVVSPSSIRSGQGAGIFVVSPSNDRRFFEVREVSAEGHFWSLKHLQIDGDDIKENDLQERHQQLLEFKGIAGGQHLAVKAKFSQGSEYFTVDLLRPRLRKRSLRELSENAVFSTTSSGGAFVAFLRVDPNNKESSLFFLDLEEQEQQREDGSGADPVLVGTFPTAATLTTESGVDRRLVFHEASSFGGTVCFAFAVETDSGGAHCTVVVGHVEEKAILATYSFEEEEGAAPELLRPRLLSRETVLLERIGRAASRPRALVLKGGEQKAEEQQQHDNQKQQQRHQVLSRGLSDLRDSCLVSLLWDGLAPPNRCGLFSAEEACAAAELTFGRARTSSLKRMRPRVFVRLNGEDETRLFYVDLE